MNVLAFALLALSSAAADAHVYSCPQVYPGKDRPAVTLTGGGMTQDSDIPLAGVFKTDDEAAAEGYDEHYAFNNQWQTRLVCLYGGQKRIKGRFHDNHEWNQRIEDGVEWSMKLPPRTSQCTLQVREFKSSNPKKSAWTVAADCR